MHPEPARPTVEKAGYGGVSSRVAGRYANQNRGRGVSMSNIHPLLPRLTVNRQFMSDFLAAKTPCFALGLVEERQRQCGFMARPTGRASPA